MGICCWLYANWKSYWKKGLEKIDKDIVSKVNKNISNDSFLPIKYPWHLFIHIKAFIILFLKKYVIFYKHKFYLNIILSIFLRMALKIMKYSILKRVYVVDQGACIWGFIIKYWLYASLSISVSQNTYVKSKGHTLDLDQNKNGSWWLDIVIEPKIYVKNGSHTFGPTPISVLI